MLSRRRLSGGLAIPIFALAIALCLTRLVSLLPYQSSPSIDYISHDPRSNYSDKIAGPSYSVPELEKRVDDAPPSYAPSYAPSYEPISDEAWKKKVVKGRSINCLFERPIDQVTQSKFTQWKDLSEWGWEFGEGTDSFMARKIDVGTFYYLATFFEKYPLPTKPWKTGG